mmetsp:Transcript_50540/g.139924  ORF Transcript_50540/g.139924 Transcript_50540/m.139924 type:complete len:290 (-) Transcript_50540:134-1003(-)
MGKAAHDRTQTAHGRILCSRHPCTPLTRGAEGRTAAAPAPAVPPPHDASHVRLCRAGRLTGVARRGCRPPLAGLTMVATDGEIVDETIDFCTYITDAAACDAWPTLSPANCTAALGCVRDGSAGAAAGVAAGGGLACSSLLQPNFRCKWEEAPFTPWTRMLAPPAYLARTSCIKLQCPLFRYARGVALEYAVLLLTLAYVPTFALHDIRRLLARGEPRLEPSPASSSSFVGLQTTASGAAAAVRASRADGSRAASDAMVVPLTAKSYLDEVAAGHAALDAGAAHLGPAV